jgi:hypothetical protein
VPQKSGAVYRKIFLLEATKGIAGIGAIKKSKPWMVAHPRPLHRVRSGGKKV